MIDVDRDSTEQLGGSGREWARGKQGSEAGLIGLRRIGPLWLALLAAGALALFLVLHSNGDSPVAVPILGSTPAPAIVTTPTATPGIVETATPVVGGPHFRLAVWADIRRQWQFGDLPAEASGYREGQAIPFLLRIDNVSPGDVHRISLLYNCGADGTAAFDFLTGYERDAGSEPALTVDGLADATIPVPDDPAIDFDDKDREADRLFRLWGASFDKALTGPTPGAPCSKDKLIGITIKVHAPTVYLLWGGHLGSSADWGEGQGAASHDSPFEIEVRVPGVAPESQKLRIAPGAVSP